MTYSPLQQNIWTLRPGTVVRVACGWYHHVALVGDRVVQGERSILSFSAKSGGFTEESFSAFSKGREVQIDGYFGGLPSDIVMQRARMKREKEYSWINFNCEHFVRYAHGVAIESPQLHLISVFAGTAGLMLVAARG